MPAWEYNKKFYHKECYKKAVPKTEQNDKHELDNDEFFRRFPSGAVRCAKCGTMIERVTLTATTDYSSGE